MLISILSQIPAFVPALIAIFALVAAWKSTRLAAGAQSRTRKGLYWVGSLAAVLVAIAGLGVVAILHLDALIDAGMVPDKGIEFMAWLLDLPISEVADVQPE